MADILLTHSNHVYSDWKQVAKMQPYPPLHTLICAAHLRSLGYEVALYDGALAENPQDGLVEALAAHRPRMLAVVEDNFNFLTKMCLLTRGVVAPPPGLSRVEFRTPLAIRPASRDARRSRR